MRNKVYLYSRVSTDSQTLEQQERTVYEWLNRHNMNVDETVSDEGISGGVSYKERHLGKVLLPMLHTGDVLIVSEISRLGRSMFDLSKLIHEELKPRKVRLIIVGMGIDLNCNEMKPIDNLILSNFAFAAELEKHLISERTKSSLAVKRSQGVKFGAASIKYKTNRLKKSKEQIQQETMNRTKNKRKNYQGSKEVQAFLKVLRRVQPDHCESDDPTEWVWQGINSKCGRKEKMLQLIRDYKELDESGSLFKKFDFENMTDRMLQIKLCAMIQNVRTSFVGKDYV